MTSSKSFHQCSHKFKGLYEVWMEGGQGRSSHYSPAQCVANNMTARMAPCPAPLRVHLQGPTLPDVAPQALRIFHGGQTLPECRANDPWLVNWASELIHFSTCNVIFPRGVNVAASVTDTPFVIFATWPTKTFHDIFPSSFQAMGCKNDS